MTMRKFGSGNSRAAKLGASDVLNIREEYAAGATQGSLARKHHISIGQIGRIVRGESWQQYLQVQTSQELEHATAMDRLQAPPDAEAVAASRRELERLLQNGPPTEDSQFLTDGSKFGALDRMNIDIARSREATETTQSELDSLKEETHDDNA